MPDNEANSIIWNGSIGLAGSHRGVRQLSARVTSGPGKVRHRLSSSAPSCSARLPATLWSPILNRLTGVFDRIDHIGVAVEDIESSLALYRDVFKMQVAHREIVEEQGVEAVLLDVGENHVELLAPLGSDTPVGKFLAKQGPGIHHVAYQVEDIDSVLSSLKEQGLRLIDETPRIGIRGSRVAFL